ncbi:solute carrier family 13 member 4 [Sinocyclocheilus grahami]|uniref:solute carrier family 13 member 4 n=1 Tax=Sinocyclocheilus grahami TaxID=75366 RepID=UPI0007ACEFA6|nr:PREDICTED: solute carrier family 13 member 4-like [Sinocyclocheilus grahami]
MRLEGARMDLIKKIWTARKLILVVMIPLSLLPLPLIHPCSESSCAYVLIVTAVYWVSEAVPLGAAALVPAFLYPLFGVLKSSEVASEYFKDTTLLLMGVICLAASIEKWNLHKRIALRMVMIAGAKPGMLVLGFMCCTVFLSMWLSNTSTTAMVMPIAEAVLQQLICTGIADSLEDSLTVDTQDEESDKEESQESSKNQLELLDRKLNEKHQVRILSEELNGLTLKPGFGPEFYKESNGYLPEAPISIPAPPRKPKIRRDSLYPTNRDHMICKCLSLSITYAATIGGLITITGTSTNLIFAEQFNNRYPEAKVINFGTWFIFSLPIALIMLMLTWIWLHCLFLGCNFRDTCSLSKKRKTRREILSEKRIHEEYQKLGPISYPEVVTGIFFILMTVLWFTREPGFVPGWTLLFEKKGYRTDATVSVLLGFLLFLIPARKPWPSAFSSESKGDDDDEEEEDPLAPMITWKDFQRLMPWEIVILVGGGYALAAGCKEVLLLLLSPVPQSETLHINPLHTLIPATMCVSFGVMLPVGNPPNAIVFSYGHVQISDMVKAGFGVNLIGVFVVMLAIMTWGEPLFHLSEFPTWALMPNVTGSL